MHTENVLKCHECGNYDDSENMYYFGVEEDDFTGTLHDIVKCKDCFDKLCESLYYAISPVLPNIGVPSDR